MATMNTTSRAQWDAARQRWVRGPEVEPPEEEGRPFTSGLGLAGLSVAAMLAASPYLVPEPEQGSLSHWSEGSTGTGGDEGEGGADASGQYGDSGAEGGGRAPADPGGGEAAPADPGGEDAPSADSGDGGDSESEDSAAPPSKPDSERPETRPSSASPPAGTGADDEGETALDPDVTVAGFEDWESEAFEHGVVFTSPDDDRFQLRVTRSENAATPQEALEDEVRSPVEREEGYEEITPIGDDGADTGEGATPGEGPESGDAPRFEYILDDGTGQAQRGIATALADDGTLYTLTAIGPATEDDRSEIEDVLLAAEKGFDLAGEEEPTEG